MEATGYRQPPPRLYWSPRGRKRRQLVVSSMALLRMDTHLPMQQPFTRAVQPPINRWRCRLVPWTCRLAMLWQVSNRFRFEIRAISAVGFELGTQRHHFCGILNWYPILTIRVELCCGRVTCRHKTGCCRLSLLYTMFSMRDTNRMKSLVCVMAEWSRDSWSWLSLSCCIGWSHRF
jgi:hypothetical protein